MGHTKRQTSYMRDVPIFFFGSPFKLSLKHYIHEH